MKVFTYFEETGINPDAAWLLDKWRECWALSGFEPVVLGVEDFRKHPKHRELDAVFKNMPTVNVKAYELACFRRWVAMAMLGGLMVDYDVFPIDLTPGDIMHDDLVFYDRIGVPCAVSGDRAGYEKLIHWFKTYEADPNDVERGVPHVSDQTVCQRSKSAIKVDWVREYGQEGGKFVHFSNNACKMQKRKCIEEFFDGLKREMQEMLDCITVVITSFNRKSGVVDAAMSCAEAGIRHVVIAASGNRQEMGPSVEIASGLVGGTVVVWTDTKENSNQSWLDGVRAARTDMVTILHDDDKIHPAIGRNIRAGLASGHRVIMWDAQYADHPTQDMMGCPLKLGESGSWSTRHITNFLSKNRSRAISPVCGAYPRDVAVSALEECSRMGKEFDYKPGFMVGNDMLLWMRVAEAERKFWWSSKPGAVLGSADSTTFKELSSGLSGLDRCYNLTRKYYSAHQNVSSNRPPPDGWSVATLCYLPDRYHGLEAFKRNIKKYQSRFPIIFYSDFPEVHQDMGEVIRIPKASMVVPPGITKPLSDVLAAQYWLHGINIAVREGLDFFVYLEADCRVTCDNWDEKLVDGFRNWGHDATCGGSPVCWHPWTMGHKFSQKVIEYAHRYQEKSGVAMALEGDHSNSPAFYPNGALGVYDTAEMFWHFNFGVMSPNTNYVPFVCFDLILGQMMVAHYGDRVFEKVAAIPNSYSGCGNHHVTQDERVEMVKSGSKVAVHQMKVSDL